VKSTNLSETFLDVLNAYLNFGMRLALKKFVPGENAHQEQWDVKNEE
jgi:hypothetical protein